MSVITISFYNGESGEAVDIPTDFTVFLYPPGSTRHQDVKPIKAVGKKFIGTTEPGIFTIHFGTSEKIISLDRQLPGDLTLLNLEGVESHAYFDVYVWDIDPDPETEIPLLPPPPEIEGCPPFTVTCAYCRERYSTPTSPYYQNLTWYMNCSTVPPCT